MAEILEGHGFEVDYSGALAAELAEPDPAFGILYHPGKPGEWVGYLVRIHDKSVTGIDYTYPFLVDEPYFSLVVLKEAGHSMHGIEPYIFSVIMINTLA